MSNAQEALPIIALGSSSATNDILRACIAPGPGFFYLANHGVSHALIEQTFEASSALFLDQSDMAMQEKQASINRSENTGWTPLEQETLDTSSTAADLKQSFYVTRLSQVTDDNEHSPPVQTLPAALERHRQVLADMADACAHVCTLLQQAFAEALELPSDTFAKHHHGAHDRLRLIHYPPAPHASPSLRAGAHTDYGSCTLLFQRQVGGLQVRLDPSRNGEEASWCDVAPREGCIVVNIGDALEFWTGGLLRSTLHRVALPDEQDKRDRFSIAYFSQPDESAVLAPMPLAPHLEARRASAADWARTLASKGVKPGTASLTGGAHLRARLEASYK